MSDTSLVGNIITGPESVPFYGCVVVERGRIVSLERGDSTQKECEVFILPGLVDAHTHPIELGLERVYVSLSPARSVKEVLDIVAERLGAGTESGVMFGFNLEPDALAEARYPTIQELDRITTAVPILLYRVDGHSAVVNSRAFELGLADPALPGCDKDGSGKPSGVLRGQAYEYTSRRFKLTLTRGTVRRALAAAADDAAAKGVTTIAALVGSDDLDRPEWETLLECLAELRIRAIPFAQTARPELARALGLKNVGGCLLLDGSFGSHTAALSQDYSDAPGNKGICYLADEQVEMILSNAEQLRLQTAFHAIGDRAIGQLVRCHEEVGTDSRLRHRIEHAELVPGSELIDRIARLGLVVCVQPVFEAWWGGPDRMYARRLGERWKQTNLYRSMLDVGILLSGGSDAPITPIDPLAGISAAVSHPNPDQRIGPEQALAMFTTNAAFSLFLEDRIGRLAPGLDADMALLDRDPRHHYEAQVLATYRAGNCIFRRKGFQSLHSHNAGE